MSKKTKLFKVLIISSGLFFSIGNARNVTKPVDYIVPEPNDEVMEAIELTDRLLTDNEMVVVRLETHVANSKEIIKTSTAIRKQVGSIKGPPGKPPTRFRPPPPPPRSVFATVINDNNSSSIAMVTEGEQTWE